MKREFSKQELEKSLHQAIDSLKIQIRDDQIEQCLDLITLFNSCGISASLVEIQEQSTPSLALALTMSEFKAMKQVLVKEIISRETKEEENE